MDVFYFCKSHIYIIFAFKSLHKKKLQGVTANSTGISFSLYGPSKKKLKLAN